MLSEQAIEDIDRQQEEVVASVGETAGVPLTLVEGSLKVGPDDLSSQAYDVAAFVTKYGDWLTESGVTKVSDGWVTLTRSANRLRAVVGPYDVVMEV